MSLRPRGWAKSVPEPTVWSLPSLVQHTVSFLLRDRNLPLAFTILYSVYIPATPALKKRQNCKFKATMYENR